MLIRSLGRSHLPKNRRRDHAGFNQGDAMLKALTSWARHSLKPSSACFEALWREGDATRYRTDIDNAAHTASDHVGQYYFDRQIASLDGRRPVDTTQQKTMSEGNRNFISLGYLHRLS